MAYVREGMDIVPAGAVPVHSREPADPVADVATGDETIFSCCKAPHYVDEMEPHSPWRRFEGLSNQGPEDQVEVSTEDIITK